MVAMNTLRTVSIFTNDNSVAIAAVTSAHLKGLCARRFKSSPIEALELGSIKIIVSDEFEQLEVIDAESLEIEGNVSEFVDIESTQPIPVLSLREELRRATRSPLPFGTAAQL